MMCSLINSSALRRDVLMVTLFAERWNRELYQAVAAAPGPDSATTCSALHRIKYAKIIARLDLHCSQPKPRLYPLIHHTNNLEWVR